MHEMQIQLVLDQNKVLEQNFNTFYETEYLSQARQELKLIHQEIQQLKADLHVFSHLLTLYHLLNIQVTQWISRNSP